MSAEITSPCCSITTWLPGTVGGIEFSWALSNYLDLTALGRQDAWEEPKGRAVPLGLHASGPALRFPDEYGT